MKTFLIGLGLSPLALILGVSAAIFLAGCVVPIAVIGPVALGISVTPMVTQ